MGNPILNDGTDAFVRRYTLAKRSTCIPRSVKNEILKFEDPRMFAVASKIMDICTEAM